MTCRSSSHTITFFGIRTPFCGTSFVGLSLRFGFDPQGQREVEGTSESWLRFHPNLPVVADYDFSGYGQPQAGSGASRLLSRALIELAKNAFLLLARDARTGVGHRYDRKTPWTVRARSTAGALLDANLDAPACRRELDRIPDEIGHHLLDAVGVGANGQRLSKGNVEPDLPGVGEGYQRIHGPGHDLWQVARRHGPAYVLFFNFCQVQQA